MLHFDCSSVKIKKKGILVKEATLQKEHLDLLGLVVPHVSTLGLEECRHYLRTENRSQIPEALRRGFVLPGTIPPAASSVEVTGYPIEDTDCFTWLGHMEQFAEKQFGARVNLREQFHIPSRLPWREVLPIFVPAGLSNRQMVKQALKAQEISVGEGTSVEKFTGANGTEVSRLYLIHRTPKPTPATMGLPPKYARHWFEGRQTRPLNLCGYGIGTGLLYKTEQTFLNTHTATASWFPENVYPSSGEVAYGYADPGGRRVWFHRDVAGCEGDARGFHEAILLYPKP